uniref:DUF6534 domain-containing protein n=1 Tax=Moniliophthora roreri TaxID=221103 RepID=A0A0W0GBW8_MONRR
MPFNADVALSLRTRSGMISGIVQAFFGWRVKILTGSWILLVIIEFCSVVAFFMGIATAIASGIVKTFADQRKFFIVVILWLVSTTLADIVITTTLVIYLKQHKTGFKQTDSQLDRIIRLTIQTGLLTAIWAMVDLLVYLLDPTGTHLIFNCVLPKLYTISLLSSLNSRGWRLTDNENILSFVSQDSIGLRHVGGHSADFRTSRSEVFVHVESEEIVEEAEKRDRSILARKNLTVV